ncbi:unnamed protein product [Pipistrellus nathusii]|uniref:non-specific serine/threonine protein kinase n=1 Tax=Pipistrellus nathusii TaxID=59473 RepID=A0ABN9ZWX5_PIPNA
MPAAVAAGPGLPGGDAARAGGGAGGRPRGFQHHKRVGPYLLGSRKLGEGSFAKVREGLHVPTGEKVAIKVIDKKRAQKDTYVTKNLRREGQIQQMIRHPNITQLLDILETGSSYYLVMELCPGGSLLHRIHEKKRLEEAEARRYIRQLVSAVEHLHRAGVVHRDLKIENLLLDEDNNIKLIDFGLSNCAGILGHSDPFSTQCGSPAYAAPELLARKKYGPKIDVWSIGVNMYAMLTGTLPFTVEPFSLRALYQKMVDKEMNPLPTQLSTGAVSFLRSLLEPDPVKRPSIQQALANRWLHESHTGRVPWVTYPNRISLADLSPSVVLHMTQRLGYKNSDVVNTVLANRACHVLAVYVLLCKKLERRLSGKPDVQDSIGSKAPLCPGDRSWPGREPCEASLDTWPRDPELRAVQDRKPKEQEKRGGLPRPGPRPPPASPAAQLPSARTRQPARPGPPDRDSFSCRSLFRKASDPSRLASSTEFIPGPPPRTPRGARKPEPPPQGPGGGRLAPRENPPDPLPPAPRGERALSPALPPGSPPPLQTPLHPTLASFAHEENGPPREGGLGPGAGAPQPLGSPGCGKSRGRFPMMGIGQMLRKRHQSQQPPADQPPEASLPALPPAAPASLPFDTAQPVQGQC